jgi:hypothetical protein
MRMRVGVTLWALSWVPYGIILGLTGAWFTVAWGFEIALGLVGIAVAGAEFSRAVKGEGWRRAPGIAWHAFRHGQPVPS